MKMVTSTDAAASVLSEFVRDVDFYLGEDNDSDKVAVEATKAIVNDAGAYKEFLLTRRNNAIRALNELGISHDFSDDTPQIGS
jgi:hypothetical protein